MTSNRTEPTVIAMTASMKSIPKPSTAPTRNCWNEETWPNRWTATDIQEYRASAGTRVSA